MVTVHRPISAIALVGLIAVTSSSVVFSGCGGSGSTRRTVPTTASSRSDRTQAQVQGSHEGAQDKRIVAAAVSYVTAAQRWLYLSGPEVRHAVEQIATPASAAVLVRTATNELAVARRQLAASTGQVWWLVRPLATRLELADAVSALVSVWVVTVLSAEGVAVPQAEWRTVTVTLALNGERWLVDQVSDVAGPTPAIGPGDRPWGSESFATALDGFVRVGSEASQ